MAKHTGHGSEGEVVGQSARHEAMAALYDKLDLDACNLFSYLCLIITI